MSKPAKIIRMFYDLSGEALLQLSWDMGHVKEAMKRIREKRKRERLERRKVG